MTYLVRELFHSLQGEGIQSGRAAVFCRFAGCNLWSGRERDRMRAICNFCDTEFRGTEGPGGGRYATAGLLAERMLAVWRAASESGESGESGNAPGSRAGASRYRYAVCTGGEPLLQLDTALLDALHDRGFAVAVETNGTRPAPPGIDWTCVSPKGRVPLRVMAGDELKLVYPQPDAPPERFAALKFGHFLLQPLDGPDLADNTRRAIAYCRAHPQWRLSLQSHKLVGIP